MAFTDSEIMQGTFLALLRHNVVTHSGYITEPSYTADYNPNNFLDVYETVNPADCLSTPTYSYTIT